MFVATFLSGRESLVQFMALLINTLLLVTTLDWDTIPKTGKAIGSQGSTRERASQVLMEHKTLQEEGGGLLAWLGSVY